MIDLLLTDNLDLNIANGDFANGQSTMQHQHILLLAHPGDIKQFPTVGVGVESFLNDEKDDMRTEIRSQFERDGMKVSSMKISGSKIEIEARYT